MASKPRRKKNEQPVQRQTTPQTKAAWPDLPQWLPYVVFCATTLIFFYDQIFGGMYFWEDFIEYIYPLQSYATGSMAQGSIPYWIPNVFSGQPFLADVQVGFFYPPNMLMALFVSDGELPVSILQWQIILHFTVAQIAMYALMRRWGVSSLPAMLSAVSYAFSSILVCHVFHPIMVYHFAWFPFVLAYADRALAECSGKYAIVSGLTFGFTMFAGHPQTTLYLSLLLFFYVVWVGVAKIRDGSLSGGRIAQFAAIAAAIMIVASGIFAIQLLHSQEFARYTERTDMTFEKAVDGSLQFSQIFSAVVPDLFGVSANTRDNPTPFYLEGAPYYYYWETAFYFGAAALMLAFIGIPFLYRTRVGGFLLFIAAFGFLFALGGNGFLFGLFFKLPFFDLFRVPARMMYFVVFGFTAFAGLALEALVKQRSRISPVALYTALALAPVIALSVFAGVLPGIVGTPEPMLEHIRGYGGRALCITLLVGALIFLIYRRRLTPLIGATALLCLAFIDLAVTGSGFNSSETNPKSAYQLDAGLRSMLTADPPQSLFRVKMREGSFSSMKRNQGMVDNIMLYEGYTPIWLERRNPPTSDISQMFDLLNIRYEIAIDEQARSYGFAERPSVLPRARMVYRAVESTPERSYDVVKAGIDFTNEVVLERAAPLALNGADATSVEHSVQCVEYGPNTFTYKVSTAENGILCLSEIWYPAWRAYVDDAESEMLRVNYSLRGIAIPAGEHTVTMQYESAAFQNGAIITLVTLLLSIGALVFFHIRERNSVATEPVA